MATKILKQLRALEVKRVVVRSQEVNWEAYFQHIKPVCPWSGAALKKGEIKIIQWSGEIEPLGNNQAIVYICPNLIVDD